jgi:hypothetical protein
MNKVKMLKSVMGVDDGELHGKAYVEGKEYTIGDSLLKNFIDQGAVELVLDTEHKAEAPAIENKAITAPENKGRRKK